MFLAVSVNLVNTLADLRSIGVQRTVNSHVTICEMPASFAAVFPLVTFECFSAPSTLMLLFSLVLLVCIHRSSLATLG